MPSISKRKRESDNQPNMNNMAATNLFISERGRVLRKMLTSSVFTLHPSMTTKLSSCREEQRSTKKPLRASNLSTYHRNTSSPWWLSVMQSYDIEQLMNALRQILVRLESLHYHNRETDNEDSTAGSNAVCTSPNNIPANPPEYKNLETSRNICIGRMSFSTMPECPPKITRRPS